MANRWYTKKEAMNKLGLAPNNNTQLMSIIRNQEMEYTYLFDEVRHIQRLMIDADAIDGYEIHHRDPDGAHEWSIRLTEDAREAFLGRMNKFHPEGPEATKALAEILVAINEAEDLTEKRRKYNAGRKAPAEPTAKLHDVKA
jgi:hypothetical protein